MQDFNVLRADVVKNTVVYNLFAAAVQKLFDGGIAVADIAFRADKGNADRGKIKQPADFIQRMIQIVALVLYLWAGHLP